MVRRFGVLDFMQEKTGKPGNCESKTVPFHLPAEVEAQRASSRETLHLNNVLKKAWILGQETKDA